MSDVCVYYMGGGRDTSAVVINEVFSSLNMAISRAKGVSSSYNVNNVMLGELTVRLMRRI